MGESRKGTSHSDTCRTRVEALIIAEGGAARARLEAQVKRNQYRAAQAGAASAAAEPSTPPPPAQPPPPKPGASSPEVIGVDAQVAEDQGGNCSPHRQPLLSATVFGAWHKHPVDHTLCAPQHPRQRDSGCGGKHGETADLRARRAAHECGPRPKHDRYAPLLLNGGAMGACYHRHQRTARARPAQRTNSATTIAASTSAACEAARTHTCCRHTTVAHTAARAQSPELCMAAVGRQHTHAAGRVCVCLCGAGTHHTGCAPAPAHDTDNAAAAHASRRLQLEPPERGCR